MENENIAWARKYRPTSINEYMGDILNTTIKNRFRDRNNMPNTILLYGTRGCGKTSGARLLAKEYLCMSPVDGHSCGECEVCKEVDQYISSSEAGLECMGITEINAADTNGKDAINEIIEEALIQPIYVTKKVLIFDECHQLSKAAQNSLLKLIEEPPSYLVFILCTTEPNLVIDTIKSRMQLQIEVKKQSIDSLCERLLYISNRENLKVSKEALRVIVKYCDRIPRESIMLLENVAKTYNSEVTLETVQNMIGGSLSELYIRYFECANDSLEGILKFNSEFKETDITIKKFISGLIRFVLDSFYIKSGINIEDYPIEYIKKIKRLFSIYNSEDANNLLEILEKAIVLLDDDNNKSELILINTAIRISKVKYINSGDLSKEERRAKKENEKSLEKYNTLIEKEAEEKINKIRTFDIDTNTIVSEFGNVSEVEYFNLEEADIKEESNKEDNESKLGVKFLTDLINNIE